jgi:K+-sensing histidine kinase KdpD
MTTSSIKNARRWAPGGPRGWYLAALSVIVATAARLALQPVLGPARPDITFYIAAATIEYYFGLWPAIAVMVTGFAITDFMFIPPYGELYAIDRHDIILAISYPLLGAVIIGLIERLRRGQYHSDMVAAVARCRYEMLLRADNDRLLARRDAGETHRLLRTLTENNDKLVFIQVQQPDQGPDAPAAMQPGNRFDDVHPDDIARLANLPTLGAHKVRLRREATSAELSPDGSGVSADLVDAVCERYTTPGGQFLILRLEG